MHRPTLLIALLVTHACGGFAFSQDLCDTSGIELHLNVLDTPPGYDRRTHILIEARGVGFPVNRVTIERNFFLYLGYDPSVVGVDRVEAFGERSWLPLRDRVHHPEDGLLGVNFVAAFQVWSDQEVVDGEVVLCRIWFRRKVISNARIWVDPGLRHPDDFFTFLTLCGDDPVTFFEGEWEWKGGRADFHFSRGDVNYDGRRDLSDVVSLFGALMESGNPEGACLPAADVDSDGEVSMSDAVALAAILFEDDAAVLLPRVEVLEDGEVLTCTEAIAN